MDYENKSKPLHGSDRRSSSRVVTNVSEPEIANAQKTQGANKIKDTPSQTQFDSNEKVAKLSINVFTETANRSDITLDELKDAQVGHSWISLIFNDPASVPPSLSEPTRTLLKNKEGTSMGFWPLVYHPNAFAQRRAHYYTSDRERAFGCTPGAGASQNPSHTGFSFWKSVPGRVEEPDKAHSEDVKIRKEYELTYSQVRTMMRYIDRNRNRDYNLYHYNCTTFAVESVKAAGQNAPSGSSFGMCFPNALYKELYQDSKKSDCIFF